MKDFSTDFFNEPIPASDAKSVALTVKTRLGKLADEIEGNASVLSAFGVKYEIRQEYAIEYVEYILQTFLEAVGMTTETFVHGSGKRNLALSNLKKLPALKTNMKVTLLISSGGLRLVLSKKELMQTA